MATIALCEALYCLVDRDIVKIQILCNYQDSSLCGFLHEQVPESNCRPSLYGAEVPLHNTKRIHLMLTNYKCCHRAFYIHPLLTPLCSAYGFGLVILYSRKIAQRSTTPIKHMQFTVFFYPLQHTKCHNGTCEDSSV